MTTDRDLRRALDLWLTEGSTEVSDRVLNDIEEQIALEPQRPEWRLYWSRPMQVFVKPVAAVAAVVGMAPTMAAAIVVLAVGGVILLSRPATSLPPGTPAPPSPSAEPSSPSAPPAPTSVITPGPDWWRGLGCLPGGQPGCIGPLPIGSHAAGEAIPGLTFTVPSAWFNTYEYENSYTLVPDSAANRVSVSASEGPISAIDLVGLDRASTVACISDDRLRPFESATQAMDALSGRPGLLAGDPIAIATDGLTGEAIDVAVDNDPAGRCEYDVVVGPGPDRDQRLTYLIVLGVSPSSSLSSAHAWIAPQRQRVRIVVLDLPGGGMVLARLVAGGDAEFEAFVATAMPIIESMRYNP